jgi:hypothetical protein
LGFFNEKFKLILTKAQKKTTENAQINAAKKSLGNFDKTNEMNNLATYLGVIKAGIFDSPKGASNGMFMKIRKKVHKWTI